MQTDFTAYPRVAAACAFSICFAVAGYADQFGDFTYEEYDTYIEITDYPEDATGDVTIPSEIVGKPVTRLGERAFYRCSSLASVTIPDSVTSIGERAFQSCENLTDLVIPDSVSIIYKNAFRHCRSLTSLTLPAGLTSIVYGTFWGCSNLAGIAIPPGVWVIGDYAFASCTELLSVTIPGSVITIGTGAFYGCRSLANVTIPGSVTRIGEEAFSGCSSLTSVTIPSLVIDIADWSFGGCINLTDVAIPAKAVRVGNAAFWGCTSLTSVTIPGSVGQIGIDAFRGCSGLTSLTISGGVGLIGVDAFRECTSLTSVTVPGGVNTIGTAAFSYCSNLKTVTIGSGLTTLGRAAFIDCDNLSEVFFEGDAPVIVLDYEVYPYPWEYYPEGKTFSGATVYYLPAAKGWEATFDSAPTQELGSLANLSTRGQVGSGDNILIGGFAVAGDEARTLLIRGIGPALAGLIEPGALLSDPMIRVVSGNTELFANDDWSTQPDPDSVAQMAAIVGAFQLEEGSKDAGLIAVLEPGAYTVHLSGREGSGIGLIELYDGSETTSGRLKNISTRGWVGTGESVMIPGIVIIDDVSRLLIRGVGPELAVSFGLDPEGVLPNPVLTLLDADGVTVATNDDWGANEDPGMIAAVSQQVGAFPLTQGSADAVLLVEVEPGVYTAHVSDVADGEGIALVEVYGAP